MHDPILWLYFVLISLCTLLPRSSFIAAGQQARLPPTLQRALRYAPAAALAALTVPDIMLVDGTVQWFTPRQAAALAVLASVLLSRNPWLPFIAGMGVLAADRLLF